MNKATFDYSMFKEMLGLKLSLESLEAHLKVSHGESVMADDDLKICIITLKLALENQMKINQNLTSRLETLETKKFKLRFWKK
jgi:hypothetical protein